MLKLFVLGFECMSNLAHCASSVGNLGIHSLVYNTLHSQDIMFRSQKNCVVGGVMMGVMMGVMISPRA